MKTHLIYMEQLRVLYFYKKLLQFIQESSEKIEKLKLKNSKSIQKFANEKKVKIKKKLLSNLEELRDELQKNGEEVNKKIESTEIRDYASNRKKVFSQSQKVHKSKN